MVVIPCELLITYSALKGFLTTVYQHMILAIFELFTKYSALIGVFITVYQHMRLLD